MRPETRARLQELLAPPSPRESGVAGVAEGLPPPTTPSPHRLSHLASRSECLAVQGVTPVTPVTRQKLEAGGDRHTRERVTAGWAEGVTPQHLGADWLDYFEERAAIREFEGGFARPEAERLALDDTKQAVDRQ
jgi:hypothetical protein